MDDSDDRSMSTSLSDGESNSSEGSYNDYRGHGSAHRELLARKRNSNYKKYSSRNNHRFPRVNDERESDGESNDSDNNSSGSDSKRTVTKKKVSKGRLEKKRNGESSHNKSKKKKKAEKE